MSAQNGDISRVNSLAHTRRAKAQSKKYQIANNPDTIWNACAVSYLIIISFGI